MKITNLCKPVHGMSMVLARCCMRYEFHSIYHKVPGLLWIRKKNVDKWKLTVKLCQVIHWKLNAKDLLSHVVVWGLLQI